MPSRAWALHLHHRLEPRCRAQRRPAQTARRARAARSWAPSRCPTRNCKFFCGAAQKNAPRGKYHVPHPAARPRRARPTTDDLGDTSTLADPSVVEDLKEGPCKQDARAATAAEPSSRSEGRRKAAPSRTAGQRGAGPLSGAAARPGRLVLFGRVETKRQHLPPGPATTPAVGDWEATSRWGPRSSAPAPRPPRTPPRAAPPPASDCVCPVTSGTATWEGDGDGDEPEETRARPSLLGMEAPGDRAMLHHGSGRRGVAGPATTRPTRASPGLRASVAPGMPCRRLGGHGGRRYLVAEKMPAARSTRTTAIAASPALQRLSQPGSPAGPSRAPASISTEPRALASRAAPAPPRRGDPSQGPQQRLRGGRRDRPGLGTEADLTPSSCLGDDAASGPSNACLPVSNR